MITDYAEFTATWSFNGMSSFHFLLLESIQILVRCVQERTYPNFRKSLMVTVDVLLSHDAKISKPM